MAHGRVLWLDVMTHEGERISIINIHQATAKRPDLQRRVNTHIQAEMNKSEGRRRTMGGDLIAAASHTGYSISTKSHFEKVDNQFQEFIQRTGGSLIQSEAHTRKDLMGGASLDDIKSATFDHIIKWNFSNDDSAEMPAPKSTLHWLGACANDHALISCTIVEQLLSYQDPWVRNPGGRTGAIKAKKIDPKQIPRIQSKIDAIMRPIAQQIITDINEGKCIKGMGLQCVVESRVATARMLMHTNPLGRDNRARERCPNRSQEQVEILRELATLIAARTTRGRLGRASASVAVQQCMSQFRLYSDFKMPPARCLLTMVDMYLLPPMVVILIMSNKSKLMSRTVEV